MSLLIAPCAALAQVESRIPGGLPKRYAPDPAPAADAQSSAAAPAAGPQVIKVPPDADQKKILRFSRFRTQIRDGDNVGELKLGGLCMNTTRLFMNPRTSQAIMAPILRVMREELTSAGYRDPTPGQQKLFEEETSPKSPDLLFGGMLEEFNTSYCSTSSGARIEGRVKVKVRWEVYDPLQRKVVLTKVAEGSYETRGTEDMREGEFFGKAYRDAVRQLLAEQQFFDLVTSAPAGPESLAATAVADKPTALTFKRTVPPRDAIAKNMALLRAAVVTVTHADGSGSGFFIADSGYVLTNSHVVGTNRFVRVILATGRELVGEVLQRDTARDTALIKTEGSNFAVLAVNTDEVNIGSEVLAIGSPLGDALSGTVTKGIVSGYRSVRGMRYIQSDVLVLPGSSGGPLLDQQGRVVGITVAGLGSARINFFVPIQDALASLGVKLN